MVTSLSVVIRIVLWLVLLIGGTVYSVAKDWQDPLFGSMLFHTVTAAAGLLLLLLAFRAAGNGGRVLRQGRTGDTPRLETNKLVTTGIYSCMRHPMLFGLTLLPPGWALLLGSPTFIVQVAPLEMLFIIVMVVVFEEREVDKKFPQSYEAYRKTVPMVSFDWRCLSQLFQKLRT